MRRGLLQDAGREHRCGKSHNCTATPAGGQLRVAHQGGRWKSGSTAAERLRYSGSMSSLMRWILRAVVFGAAVTMAISWGVESYRSAGRLGFPMDDPYIHFQYARSLATGHGLDFNPGEPSPGATSPLWVGILALAHAGGAPLEPAALVLGTLFAGISAVLVLELACLLGLAWPLALGGGLACALSGRLVWASLSGMEITLATALTLAALRVHCSTLGGIHRGLTLGALCGLAAQARPEMLLFAVLLGALEWWRALFPELPGSSARTGPPDYRAVLAFALVAAMIQAPYAAFCLAVAHRPFPNTFYAKSLLPLLENLAPGRERSSYLPILWRILGMDNLAGAPLLILGLLLGWRVAGRRWVPIAAWPLLFWGYSIAMFPRHFSLSRYTMPLIPFVLLGGLLGAQAVLVWLPQARRRTAGWVVAGALGLSALRGSLDIQEMYVANVNNIVRMQVAMADWVRAHVPPGARVATNDVGAITYISGRYCIDTMGLISTDFLTHLLERAKHAPHMDVELELQNYLAARPPEYCVLFPSWYPRLTREPWLTEVHRIEFENSTGGGNAFVAYRVTGRIPVEGTPP